MAQTDKLNTKQQQQVKKEVAKQVEKIGNKLEKQTAKQLKVDEKNLEKKLEKEIEQKLTKKFLSRSKQTAVYVGSQFRGHVSTAFLAAFGFILALVWRDLIVKLIKESTHVSILEQYPYIAELYTAILVTIVAITGIIFVSTWTKKK